MYYLSFPHLCKHVFLTVLFLFCGLSAGAQQNTDTTQLLSVPAFGDTAVINLNIEDFPPTRLTDEEMRITIMRITRYGSSERSMLNDPLFAPTEQFYGLFDKQQTPLMTNEYLATKAIREKLLREREREREDAKKASDAGTVYWWLQWLLIFL